MNNFTDAKDFSRTALTQNSQLLLFFIAVILTNAAGLIANIVLLLALIIRKPLRTSSSCALIVHCLSIDLYATAVAVPAVAIPFYLGPTYHVSRDFCRYQTLFVQAAYASSMVASSVLALHRLIATLLPHQFSILTRKPAIVCMLLFPWIVSYCINLFPALEIGTRTVRSNVTGGCIVLPTSRDITPYFLSTLFGYYIPTAVMGVSYVIVLFKTLVEVRRRQARASRALRRRLEISRTLFISFLWHCFTVYPAVIILTFFQKEHAANFSLQLAIKWLGNSFSAINPVFFLASSTLFQNGAREVIKCGFRKRSATVGVVVVSSFISMERQGQWRTQKEIEMRLSTINTT